VGNDISKVEQLALTPVHAIEQSFIPTLFSYSKCVNLLKRNDSVSEQTIPLCASTNPGLLNIRLSKKMRTSSERNRR